MLDEMCYVAMPDAAAELLFQVIAGRAVRAAVIITTNLPFSEWTTMIPNAPLCKAIVDRLRTAHTSLKPERQAIHFAGPWRRTKERKYERRKAAGFRPD